MLLSTVIMNMVYLTTETRTRVGEKGINDPNTKLVITLLTFGVLAGLAVGVSLKQYQPLPLPTVPAQNATYGLTCLPCASGPATATTWTFAPCSSGAGP